MSLTATGPLRFIVFMRHQTSQREQQASQHAIHLRYKTLRFQGNAWLSLVWVVCSPCALAISQRMPMMVASPRSCHRRCSNDACVHLRSSQLMRAFEVNSRFPGARSRRATVRFHKAGALMTVFPPGCEWMKLASYCGTRRVLIWLRMAMQSNLHQAS